MSMDCRGLKFYLCIIFHIQLMMTTLAENKKWTKQKKWQKKKKWQKRRFNKREGIKNVLYLIADDLRPDISDAYGQSQVKTPHVDKLAADSLVFAKAYCQQAVCGPSRNSFMTGRRPHRTNVLGKTGVDFRKSGIDAVGIRGMDWVTLPGHFKAAGFTTLGGGKTFSPKNKDYPRSWSEDFEITSTKEQESYFPFSYYLGEKTKWHPFWGGLNIKGPCPGAATKQTRPNGLGSPIDVWCALDIEDKFFYDHRLATNTIDQLRYASSVFKRTGKPFFVMSG